MNRAIVFFLSLIFLVLNFSTTGYSAGFQLFNELSARSTGLSSAMTARADAVESAWFNPAASAMFEKPKLMTGMAMVIPSMKLESPVGDYDMKDKVYPIPYFYGAMPLGDKFGLSMAINMPYGLTTEWHNDWIGKYYAVYTELKCLFVSPAVSIKPLDWLSFSAGPNFVYATADLRRAVTPKVPGLKSNMEGEDWAYGYTVSMMAAPFKGWTFGVTYHSQVDIGLEGKARYSLSLPPFPKSRLHLDVSLPRTVSIGIATTAIKNMIISLDIDWTDWSSYEYLNFEYDKAPASGKPGVISVPRKWEDAWAFRLGAEYLYENFRFRLGYAFDMSPIEDEYREPTLPTNDRHIFSFGLGWNYNTHLGMDFAYSYVLVEDGDTSPLTPALDGTYKGDAHVVNLALRWDF